ncbi:MAG: hypothetical protein LBV80_04205 [Deltaproteobacteria bacterium]|jgi:AcrR family transcriptional regulator|nr:hypothetical protein [Deltaproteobacteria bacterium]
MEYENTETDQPKSGNRSGKFKHPEKMVIAAIQGSGQWLGEDGEAQGSGGIVTLICSRLGISRATFYNYKARRPAIAEAYADEQEAALDLAEQSLLRLLRAGDFKAIRFYLKCRGRGRGYVEKQESGADAADTGCPPVLLVLPEHFADAGTWEAFSRRLDPQPGESADSDVQGGPV